MDNECYLFINYSEKELISHYLGKQLRIMRKVNTPLPAHRNYWHMAFLSEPDINYIKLSFPEIELIHEGGKYETLCLSGCYITSLPKNIEVDVLQIDYTDINYIHSSIKVNIFHSYENQLYYHIPKYGFLPSKSIKNYKQEKEKLDTIGEEAYYKEIDEICEKMRPKYKDIINAILYNK